MMMMMMVMMMMMMMMMVMMMMMMMMMMMIVVMMMMIIIIIVVMMMMLMMIVVMIVVMMMMMVMMVIIIFYCGDDDDYYFYCGDDDDDYDDDGDDYDDDGDDDDDDGGDDDDDDDDDDEDGGVSLSTFMWLCMPFFEAFALQGDVGDSDVPDATASGLITCFAVCLVETWVPPGWMSGTTSGHVPLVCVCVSEEGCVDMSVVIFHHCSHTLIPTTPSFGTRCAEHMIPLDRNSVGSWMLLDSDTSPGPAAR